MHCLFSIQIVTHSYSFFFLFVVALLDPPCYHLHPLRISCRSWRCSGGRSPFSLLNPHSFLAAAHVQGFWSALRVAPYAELPTVAQACSSMLSTEPFFCRDPSLSALGTLTLQKHFLSIFVVFPPLFLSYWYTPLAPRASRARPLRGR